MGHKKGGNKNGSKGAAKILQAINKGGNKGNTIVKEKSTAVTLNSLEELAEVYTTAIAETPVTTHVTVVPKVMPVVSGSNGVATIMIAPMPVISAPQPTITPEAPKTITAPAPLRIEPPILTAVKMERGNRVPPKQTKITTPKSGWGIVLDTTISLEGDKWYTKILTELPDKDGNRKWTTILAYKPAGRMPLYAECEFTLGSHNGRPTAVDVVVVSEDNPTKTFFSHLTSAEVVAHQTPLKQVYLQDLIAMQQDATLVGKDIPEKVKNFLNANGILSILGILPDGSLIVQTGRDKDNRMGSNTPA